MEQHFLNTELSETVYKKYKRHIKAKECPFCKLSRRTNFKLIDDDIYTANLLFGRFLTKQISSPPIIYEFD